MKKRNFLSCLLIIAIVLATISPTVLFAAEDIAQDEQVYDCLLYTSPSPRDNV